MKSEATQLFPFSLLSSFFPHFPSQVGSTYTPTVLGISSGFDHTLYWQQQSYSSSVVVVVVALLLFLLPLQEFYYTATPLEVCLVQSILLLPFVPLVLPKPLLYPVLLSRQNRKQLNTTTRPLPLLLPTSTVASLSLSLSLSLVCCTLAAACFFCSL